MSHSEDEIIELIEINSTSTKSSRSSKLTFTKNKIGSPPIQSPKSCPKEHNVVDMFVVKSQSRSQLSPIAKPRSSNYKDIKERTNTNKISEKENSSEQSQPQVHDTTGSVFAETPSNKSETISYRERLKARFKSVKEQAGKSSLRAHKTYNSKNEVFNLKQSFELIRKENTEVAKELDQYIQQKSINNKNYEEVTNEEKYNFFCKDSEMNEENIEQKTEAHNLEKKSDNIHKSTDILVNISSQDDNTFFKQLPDFLEFNIQLSEKEVLWQPITKRLELSAKLEHDEPRYLSEEGFYVSEKPRIPPMHLNILEQRLLATSDTRWFDCAGELNILQSPHIKASYKPPNYKQNNEQFSVEHTPATISCNDYTCESVVINETAILEAHISAIKFKHHPLFSAEHVFEQKLLHFYDIYKYRITNNKQIRLNKHLETLRYTKKNLDTTASGNEPENDNKTEIYISEIKNIRQLYFEECKKDRMILKSILEMWKVVKHIRETNKYSNTSIKLVIRKEKCDHKAEKLSWDTRIDLTTAEIISEFEFEFTKQIAAYKRDLQEWKSQKTEEIKKMEVPDKPKKPDRNFDGQKIQEEVTKQFQQSFKPPGEPILHFSINYKNEISTDVDKAKEKLRRNAINSTKINLKILCNQTEVCKSKPVMLNDRFTCIFDEAFAIQLTKIPEYISIEIYEQPGTILKRKIGEVKINIPPRVQIQNKEKISEAHFEKNELVHYKHEGTGSGTETKTILQSYNLPYNENKEFLNTRGFITYNMGWDSPTKPLEITDECDSMHVDPMNKIINDEGSIDLHKLNEWAKENTIDPQDPKNALLYEYIRNYCDDAIYGMQNKNYFRLKNNLKSLEFCDSNEIEENIRFKILQLRDKSEPEFIGMVIPNRTKEIPSNILSGYKRRIFEESANWLLENDYDNAIDKKRSQGRKYLKLIYNKVFKQCMCTQNNIVYEDVVNEKSIPRIETIIRTISLNVLNWFKFKPNTRLPLPATDTNATSTEMTSISLASPVSVVIKVESAANLPSRSVNKTSAKSRSTNNDTVSFPIRPFVTITYQNITVRTTTSEGSNPKWNEELILPLDTSYTDYLSPNAMSGSVSINMFDEMPAEILEHNMSKNWLGSIQIPVSAICYNKIEGLFKLRTPPILFGYELESNRYSVSTSRINTSPSSNYAHCAYLSLKIKLQPHIPKISPNMAELQCSELPYIRRHLLQWNEKYNNSFPNRKFSVFALDTFGKTCCITRYIRALEPPQINIDGFDVTTDQCAKYVSMIPFTDCNKFYQNVWLSTEQLLKLMIGSVGDHAIALTCYLLALNIEAYLLLGFGLPHGTTAYVLIQDEHRDTKVPVYFIYDIVTADKYSVTDTFCPLQQIYCIINNDNVWANIQKNDQVQLTRFDLTRNTDWLPLFDDQKTAPTNSFQHTLTYTITPNTEPLEARIDKRLHKYITKMRQHNPTTWNRIILVEIKNVINKLELSNMQGVNLESFRNLKHLTATHNVTGCILRLPYTSLSNAIEAVQSLSVHLQEGTSTEFAVAVHLHPYPNHVLVLYICVISIRKKISTLQLSSN